MDREHPDSGHPFTPGPTMTLRDYFAGQALAGLATQIPAFETPRLMATAAYEMADAMLKARGEK